MNEQTIISTGKYRYAPRLDTESALRVRETLRSSSFYLELYRDHGKDVAETWLKITAPIKNEKLPTVVEEAEDTKISLAAALKKGSLLSYSCPYCGSNLSSAKRSLSLADLGLETIKLYLFECSSCDKSIVLSSHRCLIDLYGPLPKYDLSVKTA